MIFSINFANGIDDNTLLVNHISGANGADSLLAIHFFDSPRLVCLQNRAIGIGNKMERQFIFGNKLLMRSR